MSPSQARTPLYLAALLVLAACASKNPGAYETSAPAQADKAAAGPLIEQADAIWAERVQPNRLAEALELYQQAHTADPKNPHVLLRLVRGWYFHGDAHSTDKQTKIDRWAKAIEFGKQCLALNEVFAGRIAGGEKEKDAVEAATKADAPCMYWTATAIGKWGKIQGIAKTLGNLPTVKAYVGTVERLDPAYFHFGPARYWGAYYSVIPSFAGQDLEKSGSYFEQSVEGAPYYLGTRVLRAENLAVKSQDVGLFVDDLQFVLDYDVSTNPEVEPENTLEKLKAQALLDQMNELFDKKTIEAYEATK